MDVDDDMNSKRKDSLLRLVNFNKLHRYLFYLFNMHLLLFCLAAPYKMFYIYNSLVHLDLKGAKPSFDFLSLVSQT